MTLSIIGNTAKPTRIGQLDVDEIQNIRYSLRAITQLLDPSADFSNVDRDDIAMLILMLSSDSGNNPEIHRCLSALADLFIPGDENAIDRKDLAVLMGYFSSRLGKALAGGL